MQEEDEGSSGEGEADAVGVGTSDHAMEDDSLQAFEGHAGVAQCQPRAELKSQSF